MAAKPSSSLPQPKSQLGRIHPNLAELDPEVRQYLPAFLESLPRRVRQLKGGLEQRNLVELAETLHKLKGSGGLYGFDGMSALAARAEATLKAGELKSLVKQVGELVDLIRRVEGYDAMKEADDVA